MQVQRLAILIALIIAAFMIAPPTSPLFSAAAPPPASTPAPSADLAQAPTPAPINKKMPTPTKAKGIVVSGYTAGGSNFQKLIDLVKRTELNAMVIDIKNEDGEVSWMPKSDRAKAMSGGVRKIKDPKAMIASLKKQNIYVIGRIVVFKDPILSMVRPDLAVRDVNGNLWKDRKGLGWGDPYSSEVWDYNMALAREAVEFGFDEIQFDYIRFPSDGDIDLIRYPHKDMRSQQEVIRQHLHDAREELHKMGTFVSADLFGFVTLVDDPGIGQRLELIAAEVDYISLMLYPSHYTKGNLGLKSPIDSPGETIALSLADAKVKMKDASAKLRPWLQDFTIRGVTYTPKEVRAQIDASEKAGVDEWLLWNANNRYSEDALKLPARTSSDSNRTPSPKPRATP